VRQGILGTKKQVESKKKQKKMPAEFGEFGGAVIWNSTSQAGKHRGSGAKRGLKRRKECSLIEKRGTYGQMGGGGNAQKKSTDKGTE